MYRVADSLRPNCIDIWFDRMEHIPGTIDTFYAVVMEYAKQYDLNIKTVDHIYQYKFEDDEFDLRFLWFGTFRIFVNVPLKRDMPEVKRRLELVCRSLNKKLYEWRRSKYSRR